MRHKGKNEIEARELSRGQIQEGLYKQFWVLFTELSLKGMIVNDFQRRIICVRLAPLKNALKKERCPEDHLGDLHISRGRRSERSRQV